MKTLISFLNVSLVLLTISACSFANSIPFEHRHPLKSSSSATELPVVDLGYGIWQATINVGPDPSQVDQSLTLLILGHWELLQLQQHPICTAACWRASFCAAQATSREPYHRERRPRRPSMSFRRAFMGQGERIVHQAILVRSQEDLRVYKNSSARNRSSGTSSKPDRRQSHRGLFVP